MDKETNLRETLLHITKWLDGDGGFDSWKPVRAEIANAIADVAHEVAMNDTPLEEAITKVIPEHLR